MKVVTDSSPLCYLVLIDQIHLIPTMLGEIEVPEAVVCELADKGAPAEVREWIARPPRWLRIRKLATESDPQLERLHAGALCANVTETSHFADLVFVSVNSCSTHVRCILCWLFLSSCVKAKCQYTGQADVEAIHSKSR